MTGKPTDPSAAARRSRAFMALSRGLSAIFILVALVSNIEVFRYSFLAPERAGDLGVTFTQDSRLNSDILTIRDLEPGSPLSRLGLRNGDRLVTVPAGDNPTPASGRKPFAGERLQFTWLSPLPATHLSVVVPMAGQPKFTAGVVMQGLYAYFARTALLIVGAFIAWRGRSSLSNLALGMAFACNSICPPWLWPVPAGLFPVWRSLAFTGWAVAPLLLLTFAVQYTKENVRPIRPYEYALPWGCALIFASAVVPRFAGLQLPNWLGDSGLYPFVQPVKMASFLCYCAAFYYLARGSLQARGDMRPRFAILSLALFLTFFGSATYVVFAILGSINPLQSVSDALDVSRYVGTFLFAYAILRHRVLDLGFALNRTLVYGAVSAVLLAAFGLIEWAVEHFFPVRGREQNVMMDAAIALGVFLTFHRVRDVAEHVIERLFFRRWQMAEAELRRFVREAAFVTKSAALAKAFAKALSQYAEGAEAALYFAGSGAYTRTCGEVEGAAARLDPDLPVLVTLRADPKPVELHDEAPGGALIAPMVNRNEVAGVVLLGPKPNGLSYRPDEIELIGWATRQVGLDLYALKVEQLEADKGDLSKTVAALERALSLKSATA
jgi:hypothetical protein